MPGIFCFRSGGASELKDITVDQVYGKKMQGRCDSCTAVVSGDVGIARIVLNGEEGVCVGVCDDEDGEFHPVAQIPWSRLKPNG